MHSSVTVHLEVVMVQCYEGLTARAGSRIWQSVTTAHSSMKMNITYIVTLTVQQLFAAVTVSPHYDSTVIICLSLSLLSVCSAGTVRLVGGPNSRSGIVEYCSNNLWGLIADPGWSDIDAEVICKQLGLKRGKNKRLVI